MFVEESLACWLESLDTDAYRALLAARADAVHLWRHGYPPAGAWDFARPAPVGGAADGPVPEPTDLAGPLLGPSSGIGVNTVVS